MTPKEKYEEKIDNNVEFPEIRQEKPSETIEKQDTVLEQEPEKVEQAPASIEKPLPQKEGDGQEGISTTPGATTPGISDDDLSSSVQEWVKKLKTMSREDQIKILCDLSVQKNVEFAVQIARQLDNAYVLDELHDTLTDELYKQLVESGKIKTP